MQKITSLKDFLDGIRQPDMASFIRHDLYYDAITNYRNNGGGQLALTMDTESGCWAVKPGQPIRGGLVWTRELS